MKSQDLVAEDVVASGDVAGDVDGPLEVVGEELVSGPGRAGQTLLGDLEELQVGLGGGGAVARALGEVVHDGALVGVGPGVPLERKTLVKGRDRAMSAW